MPARPLISVVMPTYETDPRYLREAIDSVREPASTPSGSCAIADDGSRAPERPGAARARTRAADARIDVAHLERNAGISAATNAALARCPRRVRRLPRPRRRARRATRCCASPRRSTADPELDVVYSDSDKLTAHGRRADPFFKPDWSPTYALGAMYIGHLLVVRRSLAEEVGGFDSAFDTIQDFEFMLRVSERTDRIHHIPRILYHWRAIPGSIAAGTDQKARGGRAAGARGDRAPDADRRRRGRGPAPDDPAPGPARRGPADGTGPGGARRAGERGRSRGAASARRSRGCVGSLRDVSAPAPGEVIVVVPAGRRGRPRALDADRARRRPAATDSSRSRAANRGRRGGARRLAGVLRPTPPRSTEPDWLPRLLLCTRAARRRRGWAADRAARTGARRPPGSRSGSTTRRCRCSPGSTPTPTATTGRSVCSRDVSALSGDFLSSERAAFERAGGFEENYATGYEDFDLCQRLRARAAAVVYAARPRVVVHETPASRRERLDIVDRALFVDRWYERARARRPLLQPQLHPRPRGVRDRLMASASDEPAAARADAAA